MSLYSDPVVHCVFDDINTVTQARPVVQMYISGVCVVLSRGNIFVGGMTTQRDAFQWMAAAAAAPADEMSYLKHMLSMLTFITPSILSPCGIATRRDPPDSGLTPFLTAAIQRFDL
jgi:hypothetical protein